MTGQGVVRVWKDGEIVVVLPPSASCTIERVLPYPQPEPPEGGIFILGVLGVSLVIGALVSWAMYRAGFPFAMYVPPSPPPPIPMPPKPPTGTA